MTEQIRTAENPEHLLNAVREVSGARTRAKPAARTRRKAAHKPDPAGDRNVPEPLRPLGAPADDGTTLAPSGTPGPRALAEGHGTTLPSVEATAQWADLLQLASLLDDQCATLPDDRDVHEALRAALLDVGDMVEMSPEAAGEPDLPSRAVQALVATLRRWL